MPTVVSVRPLKHYKIWVKFEDGVEGTADLSHLAGKGVFALWNDKKVFNTVRVGDSGEIAWNDQIDICPDSLYLTITGKKPEDIFPMLHEVTVGHAGDQQVPWHHYQDVLRRLHCVCRATRRPGLLITIVWPSVAGRLCLSKEYNRPAQAHNDDRGALDLTYASMQIGTLVTSIGSQSSAVYLSSRLSASRISYPVSPKWSPHEQHC